MIPPSIQPARAFRELERALSRRRLARLDTRLRLELAAIGLLLLGFFGWQVRVPLHGLVLERGTEAGLLAVLAALVVLGLIGGVLAGARHAYDLRRGPPGPPWLALPVEPSRIVAHLSWNAQIHALWMLIPAAGVVLPGIGLLPAWWLALLSAVFLAVLLESGRLSCAAARAVVLRTTEPRPGLPPLVRLLARASGRVRRARFPKARWRHAGGWRALWHNDRARVSRPGRVRRRLAPALLLLALSAATWALPSLAHLEGPGAGLPPPVRHALAFALALAAAGTFAEWIVSTACGDPFPVLRALPIGVSAAWGARIAWAILFSGALVVLQAALSSPLEAGPRAFFLTWVGLAALAVTTLGANYAVTLYPREETAQRMLSLALALSIVGSVLIPLLGWVVLLTFVLHSLRRVPRWHALEEV